MDLYDWLLFLHVFAAFLLVAALVVVVAVLRTAGSAALLPVAQRLWDVGGLLVLVFGIWLALNVDGYELWDAWILAAIVLYAIAGSIGGKVLREYREAVEAGATPPARVVPLYWVTVAGTAAILVLMIYKPGA